MNRNLESSPIARHTPSDVEAEIKRPRCPECQTEMTWQGDPCSHDDGIGYYCFADKCLWRGKSLRKIALYNGVDLQEAV